MHKPSPAMIVALLSLFVALGGAGMAATGGNLILGKTNSANATSYLSAPVGGGNAFTLSNLNSTKGSSAMRLNVASGHPPFVVNSTTRVSGLNADRLDGIAASGFVRGRGTFLANRIVLLSGYEETLLTIPGLGQLDATCSTTDAYINWFNDTGVNVDAWRDATNSHFEPFVISTGGALGVVGRTLAAYGGTLALGVGSDPSVRRTALLHAFVDQAGDGAPCGFEVQGTLWTSQ
jgi:hypothetical protein